MSTRYKLLIFYILFIALMQCSKETTGPSSEDFRYPLTAGNTWTYARTITQTYEITSGERPPDSSSSIITIKSMGQETLFDSLKTIKLMEMIETDQAMQTHYHFYQNKGDALYLVASVGAPVALPKQMANSTSNPIPSLSGLSYANLSLMNSAIIISPDSLYVEQPTKIVLKYPLTAGMEWKYSERNKPRRANKRVLGETDVKTFAGTFTAVPVQWLVDFDGDGDFDNNIEYIDYIANEGLVKRSFLINNLPIVDDDGTIIGLYDYLDVSVLTSANVNN